MRNKGKSFVRGHSQSVRLPKECRVDCDEALIYKQGDDVTTPAVQPGWDEFFDAVSVFGNDFLAERQDSLPQQRN